jgi:hypothetical protein
MANKLYREIDASTAADLLDAGVPVEYRQNDWFEGAWLGTVNSAYLSAPDQVRIDNAKCVFRVEVQEEDEPSAS